jgi:hypothetical protein
LGQILNVFIKSLRYESLPSAYNNDALEIVPLRFAWAEPSGARVRKSMRHTINISWTWFMTPIIATKEPLINLGYILGSCPISEYMGPNMVNIPCIFGEANTSLLLKDYQH